MKKIDKLVFGSFIGPFLLTLIVVDFILLLVALLKYFDQIMGKGLSFAVFAELITYFSISSSPDAFPLAVLLSSIMTFGNLGEHSELTAVKSAGISLVRVLVPIFAFVLLLTGFTYYSNTQLVPKTNLKTYSLLWDMRTKKPALDIKEGVFYSGIPGYTIKANEKVDDEWLKDIIIYDHRDAKAAGNKTVILADSGRMYSAQNQRYMILELFNGSTYREEMDQSYQSLARGGKFIRDSFKSSRIVFDLSSFDMNETDKKLFRRSRLVQTRSQLIDGIDSMRRGILIQQEKIFERVASSFSYHFVKEEKLIPKEIVSEREYYDSLRLLKQADKIWTEKTLAINDSLLGSSVEQAENRTQVIQPKVSKGSRDAVLNASNNRLVPKTLTTDKGQRVKKVLNNWEMFDGYFGRKRNLINALVQAQNNSRTTRNQLNNNIASLKNIQRGRNKFIVTKNQQVARSFSCLIMFLIGAPIGAIIKKGGMGLPVVVSISFFLVFYILNTIGEKWGKEGVFDPAYSIWLSNAVLLPFGLFFLSKARKDAKLFEADFYSVWLTKVKNLFSRKKIIEST
jgi:lipopolysaccharide export system permease protein